jgi:hypothetical protein
MRGHAVIGTGANQDIGFQYYSVTGFYEGGDSAKQVEPGSNGFEYGIIIVGVAFYQGDF